MIEDTAGVQQLLDQLRTRFEVPGAALGVLRLGRSEDHDQIDSYASGTLNLDTGLAVRPESVFQIGSITKTFTTTMIMQLVDQQKLTLDQPVSEIIDWIKLGAEEATRTVTLRHLLSHRSGIDGDLFTDFGRGDDAVSQYVRALADVPLLFAPGTMFSYCNAGYVLAGRIIEEITGTSWDQALHDQILGPLGLAATGTFPEEAILHTAAVGHSGKTDEERTVIPVWQLPRSVGPAGLINSTVTDVLTYARMHLRGGALGDAKIISTGSTESMQSLEIRQPHGHLVDGYQSLGWAVDHWDGHRVFGHNGATVGQYAFLQSYPDQQLALCLLTNGPGASNLWRELRHDLLKTVGLQAPLELVGPPAEPYRPEAPVAVLGRFGRISEQYDISQVTDGLELRISPTEGGPEPQDDPITVPLLPVDQDHFVARSDSGQPWTSYSYGTFTREQSPTGGDYLYTGSRLTPRLG